MSHYELMDAAYDLATAHNLTATDLNILIYLTHKTRRGDTCWPSLDLIAEKTHTHRTTASRTLCKLHRLNIVEKRTFQRAATVSGRPTNEYRLNFPSDNILPGTNCSSDNILLLDKQYTLTDSYYMNRKVNSNEDDDDDKGEFAMLKTSGRKDHPAVPDHADPDLYGGPDETPEDVVAEFEGRAMKPAQQEQYWRRIVAAAVPGYKPDTITAKQAGMLKATFTHFGTEAIDFIRVIVENWESFASECMEENGAYKKTKYPTLGFLSGNKAFALPFARNLLIEQQHAAQLVASSSQTKHTVDEQVAEELPIEALKPVAKEAPATLEDLLKISEELQNGK